MFQPLFCHLTHIEYRASRSITGVGFHLPNFPSFSVNDLQRLKTNFKWLSDSHLTFALRLVAFFCIIGLDLNETVIVFEIAPIEMFGVT